MWGVCGTDRLMDEMLFSPSVRDDYHRGRRMETVAPEYSDWSVDRFITELSPGGIGVCDSRSSTAVLLTNAAAASTPAGLLPLRQPFQGSRGDV